MEKLFLLFLFFHVSSPVKHSLRFLLIRSVGMPDFPEVMITVEFDNTVMGYCDTNEKKVELKHDSAKQWFKNNPDHLEWSKNKCFTVQPHVLTIMIDSFMQLSNQTGGVHILQRIYGYELDNETGEMEWLIRCGYDGEDIFKFDLEKEIWIALKPEAETIKQIWNDDKKGLEEDVENIKQHLPALLKEAVAFTNGSLMKTELPSVSLLQQTPSSPVRCFASGFYPERASLFWRKDGVELHEDVELGETLPNTDGTFQMSADLKVSSVSPEDWRRYECVFQLSGVKDDIVTKLDKTAIKTNYEKPKDRTVIIVTSVVCPAVFIIAAIGLLIYKLRRDPYIPIDGMELQSSCCRRS